MDMNDTSQFLDIVIFAMIAVFLGLRLRSVLGRRNPDQAPLAAGDQILNLERSRAPVIDMPTDPLAATLARIKLIEPSFDADQFLQGAARAFEMIVQSFAAGDLASLRPLLSDTVFADFKGAIEVRGKELEDQRMELLHIVSTTLAEASLTNNLAEISVRFVSEQKGADGHEARLIDLWRFGRTLGSSDPNWRLVATGSLDA
jgi:predicted lipid-binding transport protein (Tim44 family)